LFFQHPTCGAGILHDGGEPVEEMKKMADSKKTGGWIGIGYPQGDLFADTSQRTIFTPLPNVF
jgi:hypothetical protein